MKKVVTILSTAMLFSSLSFGTAFAFTDVDESQSAAISMLQERGIISGLDNEHFVPQGAITYAQSVQLIVKAFGYSQNRLHFVKLPVASDLFTNIQDDAWYANAFVLAHYYGVDIPKDVNPNETMTREQFANMLDHALEKKAKFPFINIIPLEIEDGKQINPEFQGSIQRLLHYKIVVLEKDGKFSPRSVLTRGEAATWTYNAIKIIDAQQPVQSEKIELSVEKVNDDISKVTVFRGEKPNAGFTISIDSIRFEQDGHAVIRYTLQDPKPDQMYVDVVTVPKAVTYIPSQYKVVLEPEASE